MEEESRVVFVRYRRWLRALASLLALAGPVLVGVALYEFHAYALRTWHFRPWEDSLDTTLCVIVYPAASFVLPAALNRLLRVECLNRLLFLTALPFVPVWMFLGFCVSWEHGFTAG